MKGTYLEKDITLLPGGLGLCGINVRLLVGVELGLFGLSQFGENVGGSVLGKGFVEEFDCLLEITKLLVGGSYSAKCPLLVSLTLFRM
jgi:hypothetical protein